MLKPRYALLSLLVFGVVTVWVPARWARSVLEGTAFLLAAAHIAWCARTGRWPRVCFPLAAILGVCCWAGAQLCFGWTAVEASTTDALLYWLAAACLVWLGCEACRLRAERIAFFQSAVAVGAGICFAGIVQLYTSMGKVFWIFPSGYDTGVTGPFVSANDFACFVELLLPAALALAAQLRAGATAHLLTAGGLAAAVMASGSRTGTVIVVVESGVLLAWHCRSKGKAGARGAGVRFSLSAVAGMLVFGCQSLFQRFLYSRDSFVFRREFLKSALAMFRARPLTGFGLGTWSSVYRQFARFDAGAVVNHAHNEWAQWAAEGGVITFALLAAVLVWCIKPARRTRWGLGVLAVFMHATVDYPFARLGLSAWIFVWIGALAAADTGEAVTQIRVRPILSWTMGCVLSMILLCAASDSWRLAYADSLYRRGDSGSVARAEALCPNRAEYRAALAEMQPESAPVHLRRALALDPYQTGARISMAADLERHGDLDASERELLKSADLDHQLAPAWSAANFYFRSGRPDEFWRWASRSASLMRGSMDSLFDLCFLVSDEVRVVESHLAGSSPDVPRRLLDYLAAKGRAGEAHDVAVRVANSAGVADRDRLLDYVDHALAAGSADDAIRVWNQLCARSLLTLTRVGDGTLVNGDFRLAPAGRGFDWRLPATPGVSAIAGQQVLKLTFSGNQPENCEILSQWIKVRADTAYSLRFEYRTEGLPHDPGLLWSIAPRREAPLIDASDWRPGEYRFHSEGPLASLRLWYRRRAGTTRITGALWLRQINLNLLQKNVETADKH
jgi:O-antigen ligase